MPPQRAAFPFSPALRELPQRFMTPRLSGLEPVRTGRKQPGIGALHHLVWLPSLTAFFPEQLRQQRSGLENPRRDSIDRRLRGRRNLLITQLFRKAQAKSGSQRLGQKRVEPFRGRLGFDALELVVADGQLFLPLFALEFVA